MPEGQGIVRVVVADDSEIASAFLERLLEEDSLIRVVGRAANGAELLALPARNIAHVVLLDVLMPEMGGLSVIRQLSASCSIIAISSVAADSAVAREALALGATAFFNKRDLASPAEAERLRETVRGSGPVSQVRLDQPVVLVVGSTGAVSPLEILVRDLTPLSLPVLVVQHMPEGKDGALAQLLSLGGGLARVAQQGELLRPGVLVGPSGRHLEMDGYDRVRLTTTDPVNGHRPSGDVLLRSAMCLGKRALAVILSGLGNDGAQAMAALAEQGGVCFAQDPEEASAPSMPRAALAASPRVRPVRMADLGPMLRKNLGA
jgi:two-component system chemotaxis response regulator CheB